MRQHPEHADEGAPSPPGQGFATPSAVSSRMREDSSAAGARPHPRASSPSTGRTTPA